MVSLDLRLSSTASETDLWAVVSDVWPDGTSHPMATGRLLSSFPEIDAARLLTYRAAHLVSVFVLNDDGVWLLKRPQDYPRLEVPELVEAARKHQWLDLYTRSRVRIADQRLDVPRQPPFVPPFNKWSANVRGTTYFLPIAELSGLFLNVLLAAFSEEVAYFVVDERHTFQPAGVAQFARSKGGYLRDNLAEGRVATVGLLDTWMYEFAAVEQGAMLQNLALVTAALGLGGHGRPDGARRPDRYRHRQRPRRQGRHDLHGHLPGQPFRSGHRRPDRDARRTGGRVKRHRVGSHDRGGRRLHTGRRHPHLQVDQLVDSAGRPLRGRRSRRIHPG